MQLLHEYPVLYAILDQDGRGSSGRSNLLIFVPSHPPFRDLGIVRGAFKPPGQL